MGNVLVKSPVTTNGVNPRLDNKGQIIYKETILTEAGGKLIEKINGKLPQHLKKIVTPLETPAVKPSKDDKK